nr:hypothetical protein GCM10025699_39630 [Microbacterium flavescens]
MAGRHRQGAGVPAYVVFGDATLRGIASARPTSSDQLSTISGVGQKKLDTYGQQVLDVVAGTSPEEAAAAAATGGGAAPSRGGGSGAPRPSFAEPAVDDVPVDEHPSYDEPRSTPTTRACHPTTGADRRSPAASAAARAGRATGS